MSGATGHPVEVASEDAAQSVSDRGDGPTGVTGRSPVVGHLAARATAESLRSRATARLSALPLRTRLVAILLAALFAALAGTGYGVQAATRGFLVGQVDDQLAAVYTRVTSSPDGDYLRGLLTSILGQDGQGGPGAGDAGADEPTTFDFYKQVDGGGASTRLLLSSPLSTVVAPQFPSMTSAQATALAGAIFTVPAKPGGSAWRAVAVPALFGTNAPGSLIIALPLRDVDRAVDRLRLLTLLIGALVAAACTIVGWLAIRRSFRPLLQVEDTAAAIAAGDLSRRVPAYPPGTEVGRLTTSLNGMLTQIESAFRARQASEARTRRFAADASHELRTPLASIRGFAELHRQGAVPAAEVPRTMRRIEDEAKRMGGLVEDLLLLARLDEQRPARTDPVDLAVLAGDAVHDVRGIDPDRTVRLVGLSEAAGPVPAVVTGDEDRLRQVVANLVANAVLHTTTGTPIEVAVGRRGDAAILEVRDHGPGLPADQLEKIFERFYRVDASRRRGNGGGSGLGLSIVSAVITSHNGNVAVSTTPGGGATFTVSLPARPLTP